MLAGDSRMLQTSRIDEIKVAIERLSEEDVRVLFAWFREFEARVWDREFEEDVIAGRLDSMGDKAERDFNEGKCRDL